MKIDIEELEIQLPEVTIVLDDETMYWTWDKIGGSRGSTYEEVIKAWETENGYRYKKYAKWEKMNSGDLECSICGWESDTEWDFCPNCGSNMIEQGGTE